MAKVIATQRCIDDAAAIWSDKVKAEFEDLLRSLEAFPEMGSQNMPDSITEEFGEGIRKLVIGPFDLVYEYDEKLGAVFLLALVPQLRAH